MKSKTALLEKIKDDLKKSLNHLDYSFKKSLKIDLTKSALSEEELEVLESFSSRFVRSSDLIVSQLLRLKTLELDPAFRGSLIDTLNTSEKHRWIESAATWMRIRELRNNSAHEYSDDDLKLLYGEFLKLAPSILSIKSAL